MNSLMKNNTTSTAVSSPKIERTKSNILNLIGSSSSKFQYQLSLMMARQCTDYENLDRSTYNFMYAVVDQDGSWSFPKSQEEHEILSSERMMEKDALDHIIDLNISVMLPHMFCNEGMTRYRGLFEKLNIPFLGNKESTIKISIDKGFTKDILAKAKISVPKAQLLIKGVNEIPEDYSFPCIVKSCTEDNTVGVKYVKTEEEMILALEHCFNLGPRVLVEEYIKGKEMRAGIIEEIDGSLTVLPKIEYYITGEIRTLEDKLVLDENGNVTNNSNLNSIIRNDRQCPAQISDILDKRINELVINAHKALNCRHYSIFDIRVDENEIPYILESCLFCSFAPNSAVVSLANEFGREEYRHPNLFHSFLKREIDINKEY